MSNPATQRNTSNPPPAAAVANNVWEAANAASGGMPFEVWTPVAADEANAEYDRRRALDGRPADPRRWEAV